MKVEMVWNNNYNSRLDVEMAVIPRKDELVMIDGELLGRVDDVWHVVNKGVPIVRIFLYKPN